MVLRRKQMAFDGSFTKKIVDELNDAVDCHIDKIYQPSRDELVFLLRKKGFAKRLLICARPGVARIHFTETKYENPAVAPMFCMLARKHFSSARLISVTQPDFERIVELHFEATNEMGDRVNLKIICEFIGNQTNIILVDNNNRILDAVRRSDIESTKRLVQPGAVYEYPETQGKINPLLSDTRILVNEVLKQQSMILSKALLNCIDGLSPLICREIAFKSYNDDVAVEEIKDTDPLVECIENLKTDLTDNKKAILICREDGSSADFTYTEIEQYGSVMKNIYCENYSKLLDEFYAKRENEARIKRAATDVSKLVNNAYTRAVKRLAARKEELKNCEDRENLRIYGELLKANLYRIENGSRFAEVENYYDPEFKTVRIPLDPALTPANNAAKYFKDYKKSYTAQQTLTELTAHDKQEIVYLESVVEALDRCETLSDLGEIRDELYEAGYIHRTASQKKSREPSHFLEYTSAEGYRILVGRNNRQNDYITTKLASKNDMWFHVKNIPGSHVIVFSGGGDISEETLVKAATLAAENSKASRSAQVPVDYTPIKYVKKPNGAKPGMVIYTTNRTLFVTPAK